MRRIVTETECSVTPNDFYDIPATNDEDAYATITVEIDEDLLREAKHLGTDLNALAERSLRQAIVETKRARWREENAAAIAEANQELAQNGLWSDDVRLF